MTYRGVYRDGIVILQGDVDLRNGDTVEVNSARARKPARRAPTKTRKTARVSERLPAFGIWKDRWPKSMSSAQIARELREQASRRVR
ncbi:hypothetical protein PHYC_03965 [Phycisphaerales bacterium]|nr:hypothetical protein PHYC_03965 [Phycisphaerales bacterium]